MINRIDLPLDHDAHARFLPWLIAFMVYLAVLAVVGIMVLSKTVNNWDRGVSGTLTVQLAPDQKTDAVSKSAIQETLEVLRSTPGVIEASLVSENDTLSLVEPWLGDIAGMADLPLPRLIDVTMDVDVRVDIDALNQRLAISVPGASVDDHGVWLDRLVRMLQTLQWIAISVVTVIVLVTVGTVVFTTKTGLAVHGEAIQVLHLIGAQDSYVARQFASRALWLGLRGGLTGLLFAIPTLYAIRFYASHMQLGSLSVTDFAAYQYLLIAVLPVIVAIIAMMTARNTVLRTLARMP